MHKPASERPRTRRRISVEDVEVRGENFRPVALVARETVGKTLGDHKPLFWEEQKNWAEGARP